MANYVLFDAIDSRELGLIYSTRQISAPAPRTELIDIPGRDGSIDVSEHLGALRYKDRSLSITFYCTAHPATWGTIRSQIQGALNGTRRRIIFGDDPGFYWVGRPVADCHADGNLLVVTVSATVDPYKYDVQPITVDWLWDDFSFDYGILNEDATEITITTEHVTQVSLICHAKTMTPTFSCTGIPTTPGALDWIDLRQGNESWHLHNGENKPYGLILHEGENILELLGNGTVRIDLVGGIL